MTALRTTVPLWGRGPSTAGPAPALDPTDDEPAASVAVPRQVGRYRVGRLLGEGGMARVHEAYDPHLDRRVALKLVPLPVGRRGEIRRMRMLREAQALARLCHPQVVDVYDLGVETNVLYIAMELVEGCTLQRWLDAFHDIGEILDVMIGAGEGLAAAHAQGMVHRDFKPANVLVGCDGRVRLVDFGLARHHVSGRTESLEPDRTLDDEPVTTSVLDLLDVALTDHGTVMGTPAYMAPECSHTDRFEPASDQFAFCVTLFEALLGARPFPGDTAEELRSATLEGRIDVPRGSRLPTQLSVAIRRGLMAHPQARWSSMDALLDELREIRAHRRRRSRLVWVLAAGVGLLGAALSEWSDVPRITVEQDRASAIERPRFDPAAEPMIDESDARAK